MAVAPDSECIVTPPVASRAVSGQTARWQAMVLAGLAVVTLIAAVAVVLAPVRAEDPVISWPPAGQQPRSTVLPLVPYRPLSLQVRVPCDALAALDRQPGGGDALRTLPATAGKPGSISQGLVVAVRRGVVQVSASGKTLLRDVLPAGGCTYQVLADSGGVRVLRDGRSLASASLRVPEVSELTTELEGQPGAVGLAVSLHTDARYESTPTALKIGLLGVCAAALLALLGLAWRWWGGRGVPMRGRVESLRPRLADAVLVVVSAVWVLLAPTNFDDSWYLLMARGATASGSVGNAIYMFNVTENPFVASQYVLQVWGWLGHTVGLSWELTWMRLVPLIYGLATWLLLRLFLVAGFGRELGTGRAAWALLVAYLLWWLPYGMTLRPEPLIVLLSAATLLLAELARRRHCVGALAVATATAALAISVSPSGLVASAPLVLSLPWLWRWLRGQDAAARSAAVALLVAATTSLVLVGFADATLGDVLESSAVHKWYYQTFSWYREYVHYQTILSFEDSSQWGRRAPVVLTIAVLLLIALSHLPHRPTDPPARIPAALGLPNSTAALFTRLRTALLWSSGSAGLNGAESVGGEPVRRVLGSSAACSALALVLLAPTPTKFVNHFGAAAAAPTVLLAAVLLRSPMLAAVQSAWQRHRAGAAAAIAGTALLVGAVSWSFAGPNLWRPYSDRGQPFGNHLTAAADHPDLVGMRPKLGPVQLANPAVWVAVAPAAACWMWWRRRHGRDSGLTPDRAVLLGGSTAIVVMTIVVFVWAPLRQYPGWSVALSTIRAVQGHPCALAGYAQVLVDTAAQPVPFGSAITEGGFTGAAARPLPVPVPAPTPGTLVWHDAVDSDVRSDPDTGSLTSPGGMLVTPWFALPADGGTTLLVPLLGARAAQQLTLEYATAGSVAGGVDPAVAGSTTLRPDPAVPRTQWYQAAVALDRLGKQRPSSVRVVIRDWMVTDADSWLAVGQPRLASWRPLTTVTAGRSVYVDQLTAALLPCLDQVGVAHGIARAPQVLVLSDEGFGRGFLDLGFELSRGGIQVPVSRSAIAVRMPARLMPSGPPTLPWGRVERVLYDHPVGLVDLHVDQRRRAGWTRLPTLAAKTYHGNSTG